MDNITNEMLGRFMDEQRTSSEAHRDKIDSISESVILIRERTKILPDLVIKVKDNADSILIINTQHQTEEKTLDNKRKNLKFFMYSVGFMFLLATTYGSILAFFAK